MASGALPESDVYSSCATLKVISIDDDDDDDDDSNGDPDPDHDPALTLTLQEIVSRIIRFICVKRLTVRTGLYS